MDMKLVVFVLNKTEKLEAVLEELARENICGGTILRSEGMARVLKDYEGNDIPFIGSIRAIINPERKESRTLLLVIKDEQLEVVTRAIEKVVGDICGKDTGIVFSVPVDFTKGLPHLEF
ncbi:MAG TPA: hypothetical protein PK629_06715 [Oscillospiraceae bacterium]|nr:hypothetical protein [Oscillospiraceae bacterium]HPF55327.1 hypothetical protein [Clostridiales bacterium]HPK36089.1 hypothetical protein [Oscillospiraceae bacterium]HPR76500.1 hypothetical protein [Oscillospiraceae bacterium]